MNIDEASFDIETIFHAQYKRIARAIQGVIRDPARAEELAVEVFLKWSRNPAAHGEKAGAWLYRTAIRIALNELRQQTRRSHYERLVDFVRGSPSPHELFAAREEEQRVRLVL